MCLTTEISSKRHPVSIREEDITQVMYNKENFALAQSADCS